MFYFNVGPTIHAIITAYEVKCIMWHYAVHTFYIHNIYSKLIRNTCNYASKIQNAKLANYLYSSSYNSTILKSEVLIFILVHAYLQVSAMIFRGDGDDDDT